MPNDRIYKEARHIVRMCETRDPMKIAKELGIHVMYRDDLVDLKGMYTVMKRSRFIFLNSNLSDFEKKTVCAHEIGHDRFHRALAGSLVLQEFGLYDMRTHTEYEANIFAGELLIGDDDIFSLMEYEYDFGQIAGELGVDYNLVLIKTDELRKRGYDVQVPYRPQSDFLGR